MLLKTLVVSGLCLYPIITSSQSSDSNSSAPNPSDSIVINHYFPQIEVVGRRPELLARIPGSATVVDLEHLQMMSPLNGNEVFKQMSGVNVVDEEGAGLRLNIGVRGLDPDRSRTVLIMEDGVPVSLAPYGEPEMYYTPSMDRMVGVEVIKGSGSILFGPQTIGGVINYITADPPIDSFTTVRTSGGFGGYYNANFTYGSSFGNNNGLILGLWRKKADKLGTTSFSITDLTSKIKLNLSPKTSLGLKFSVYDEVSNSTYIGITQSMFNQGNHFNIIAPNDELQIRRLNVSATHNYFVNSETLLKTTAFFYTTKRDWRRQNFSRTPTSNPTHIVGDTQIPGGAIYFQNSTGNRNRQFEVFGVEPRLTHSLNLFGFLHEIETGYRFLYEKTDEQRIDGKTATALSGDLKEDEIRSGIANSFFIQDRIFITNKLTTTVGARIELFSYDRNIFRLNNKDTSIVNNNSITAFIPGIGFNYLLSETNIIFAGIHKGFAPPRVKDAITNGGLALNLDAETSMNYEVGFRLQPTSVVAFDFTVFYMPFENQIIPVSESSGGTGTGLVNGGKTLHYGFESNILVNVGQFILPTNYLLQVGNQMTYSIAKFANDRYKTVNGSAINITGNKLPYAPEWTLNTNLNLTIPLGLQFQVNHSFVSEQFSDELNTVYPIPNGEAGLIPSYSIWNSTAKYTFKEMNLSVFVSIKNILDERYIASRRPQGIKVGIPQTVTFGVDIKL